METDKIKNLFDDFVQQNQMFLQNADEFIEYSYGVAETMIPIVKSFNLSESDEEFSIFCALFHRVNEFENYTDDVLYGSDSLLAKTFPDNSFNYEFILHEVIANCKSAQQPLIPDQRTGTFVHLLRDAIFLYNAKASENKRAAEGQKTITDTLSIEVQRKIDYKFPIYPEDVVTEADEFARQISLFQSIVFVKSKDIIEDNNYFLNLCNSVNLTDAKTQATVSKLMKSVSEYLAQRENITAYRAPATVKRFSFPIAIKIVGIAFILAAIVGTFFMAKSMISLSKTPDWQALKQTGKAKSFFGNPFEVVFGESSEYFSTDFDGNVNKAFMGVWALCETGKPVTAMNSLIDRLAKNPNDIDAATLLIDLCMRYGYYGYFNSIFNTYLASKTADANDVARINRYLERLDSMDLTVEEIENIFESDPFDETKEDVESYRTRISKKLEGYLNKEDYDKEVLYEYLMMFSSTDSELQKYALRDAEFVPYSTFPLIRLATSYRRCGRQVNAIDVISKAYAINSEDPDVMRVYATIEMVNGNMVKALEYAESAFNDNPEGDYVIETYLIALCENNRRGDATVVFEQMKTQGYVFEDDFLLYWNGAVSLKDYYVEKEVR